MTQTTPISPWRKALAYWWYLWGLSWCHWGIRSTNQTFFRAGINAFDRALKVWPQFAEVFYRRGLIRGRELGAHQAGIADLSQAIALDPEWAEPYLQRGLFQRFHGDQRAALEDLQQYLNLSAEGSWRTEAARQIALIQAELEER